MVRTSGRTIIIIGGGPGGYPAAIKASQLGADVTLIEKSGLGGTCLNCGCIPTKYLLKSSGDYYSYVKIGKDIGGAAPLPPDLALMMNIKGQIINQLSKGTQFLLEKNGVKIIKGTAAFVDQQTIRVEETGQTYKASSFIIATGSESSRPPIAGIDLEGVLDSDQMLNVKAIPAKLVIIGGGVIGLEFAQIFSRLGSEVSIVEMLPRILSTEEEEVSSTVNKIITRSGIKVTTNAAVKSITKNKEVLSLKYVENGVEKNIDANKVLLAVGRRPFTSGLNLEKIGVAMNGKAVVVNNRTETNVKGIYAVGDATGGIMLAHKATAEGECAAHNAAGEYQELSFRTIPRVVYTKPEIASAGLGEEEARKKYNNILVGRFPLSASGRALVIGENTGFVKVIAEGGMGRIIGVSIVGPGADEVIGEATLAIQMEATLDDISDTVHAHPTIAEAFKEAVLDAKGGAIHIPPRKT